MKSDWVSMSGTRGRASGTLASNLMRPGRIKEVITVGLPRPRSLEMVNSPEFGALFDRTFHLIREEVTAAMAQQDQMAAAS